MLEIDPIVPNIVNKGKLSANRIIFMSIILISLGLGLIKRNIANREDYIKISGPIQHFSSAIPIYPDKSREGKFRWLKLYTNERTFELFVGKDKDKFSPRIDHLDKLREGDIIDLYFEENQQTLKNPVNTLVEYIDYKGNVYYRNGNADKFIGYFTVGISLILLFVGIYRKRQE